MNELIFFEPCFKKNIWGGNKLSSMLGFEKKIQSNGIGEAWIIAAHENGSSKVVEGKFKGKTLSDLWAENREFFGNIESEKFPLLIKLIDAEKDLSIQVHPDDYYANLYENGSLGKTECWYIVDCEENATIIMGHNAKTKEEFKRLVNEKKWSELLCEIPIKKGDFFQIPSGTLHAIKKGTIILETQQNSDITYRVYDYDRLENGKPRDLQLDKALDVIRFEDGDFQNNIKYTTKNGLFLTELIRSKNYCVTKWRQIGSQIKKIESKFELAFILEGKGKIDNTAVKEGMSFMIPAHVTEINIKGDLTIIFVRT